MSLTGDAVAVSPIPSAEQIIQLYEAGNLAVDLAEYCLPDATRIYFINSHGANL